MNKKKNILSCTVAIAFLFMAAGSAKVNKIGCGAFAYTPSNESKEESDYYVLLNDGTKVFGDKKVKWQSGLIVKDIIKVDDQKFAIKETRGYFANGVFFGRYGHEYVRRIIHGKLNVYYKEEWVNTHTTDNNGVTRWHNELRCSHYAQVGETGELKPIADQNDIKELVQDCPIAYEMIDKKSKAIRKAIRKNRAYLNEIFMVYNNNCREL